MTQQEPIKAFTDLKVWQQGHGLVILVYQVTATFPAHQQFGLTSQLQRASVSITSNIAEGFGRSSIGERKQFYMQARGSTAEVQNQLLIAKDTGIMNPGDFNKLYGQSVTIYKMLNALLRANRTNTPNSNTLNSRTGGAK